MHVPEMVQEEAARETGETPLVLEDLHEEVAVEGEGLNEKEPINEELSLEERFYLEN
jgi:hypothetical protein